MIEYAFNTNHFKRKLAVSEMIENTKSIEALLLSVYGTEDQSPIKINVTAKKVSASRDDVELSTKNLSWESLPKTGSYSAVISAEGAITFTKLADKPIRQSPAFDYL